MGLLGDDFRRRSDEHNETAASILVAPDFVTDPKKQTAVVVAKVTANVLQLLGETVDYLEVSSSKPVQSNVNSQHELRKAAAIGVSTGDWSKFNELVEQGHDSGSGSDGV